MIKKKDKNVQFFEYANHLTNHINSVDRLRKESLQRLHEIRSKRQKSQKRHLKHLTSKYGEKHPRVLRQAERIIHEKEIESYLSLIIDYGEIHPRVLRQAERIINEKEMENYLSLIFDKADCEMISIKDSHILHGRVVTDEIKGLSGIRIQLLDAENHVIGKPVKTDNKGSYVLVIDVDESLSSNKLNIVVLDKKGEQIHKEKLPILVVADSIESRDIVIAKLDCKKPASSPPVT
jgi:hypothetical protein